EGEYCMIAPLFTPDGKMIGMKSRGSTPSETEKELPFGRLQSRPLFLMPGIKEKPVDFDLCATGRMFLVSQNVPDTIMVDQREYRVFVTLQVLSDASYHPIQPVPSSDEPPEEGWPLPLPPSPLTLAGASKRGSEPPKFYFLPPRNYYISVCLTFFLGQAEKGMGEPSVRSKQSSQRLEIRPGETTTLSVSIPGVPLQEQLQ